MSASARSGQLVGLILVCLAAPTRADIEGLQRVASGLSAPIAVTHAPGDSTRLFIAERGGAIKILDRSTGVVQSTPFLTIPDVMTDGEGGLLGLAFHPDYQTNGKFYVNVTANDAVAGTPFSTYIREYTVGANLNVANSSAKPILSFTQPQTNHNGGWIGFSPNDHFLYIASGDGGNSNDTGTGHTEPGGNAQDLTSNKLGKMLRIDVNTDAFLADANRNYTNPLTNPFTGTHPGDDEIWSYGLRNPFRSSFDRETGDLWIGDVGQGAREEIDFQAADSVGGENYGWRLREGTIATPGVGGPPQPGFVDPVYDYRRIGTVGVDPDFTGNSVIGGYVYRGPDPALEGMYFFTDSSSGRRWMFDPADPLGTVQNIDALLTPDVGSPSVPVSFGEDAMGNLYIAYLSGEVYQIATAVPEPATALAALCLLPLMFSRRVRD